jgi:hypothetical protein
MSNNVSAVKKLLQQIQFYVNSPDDRRLLSDMNGPATSHHSIDLLLISVMVWFERSGDTNAKVGSLIRRQFSEFNTKMI